MRFITVDPKREQMMVVDFPELSDAMEIVGLRQGMIDHAVVYCNPLTGIGLGIVVYEFGLFERDQHYFLIGDGRLYAGCAVLYAFDAKGNTIDMPDNLDKPN